MILGEGTRKALAVMGCVLWIASSFMPLFGGAAEHQVLCRGKSFSGEFDDCFNDMLPIFELAAPVVGLALLWPFALLAFAAVKPKRSLDAIERGMLGSFCLTGVAWGAWRAVLYPVDRVTAPFIGFWCVFAIWFAFGAWQVWIGRRGVSHD